MSNIYEEMCAIKPEVRDVLWAYKRDHNIGKAVDKMEVILTDVWNAAIEDAATMLDESCGVAGDDIRKLNKCS